MNEEQQYHLLTDQSTVNINGDITPARDAKISIFDRGFLYGDSIYEVTYSHNGSLIFLNEHIDRLFHSAKLLDMEVFLKREEIIQEILKTTKASKLSNAYVRIILTRGETTITLNPYSSFKNNLIIIVKPKTEHPDHFYKTGIKLFIPDVLRNQIKSVDPNAKSGNYLNNVMAMAAAKNYGADDAVMINSKNEITEGTTFNIYAVIGGSLLTPDVKSGLLKGITRQKVLEICEEESIPIQVTSFTPEKLLSADEVFITSSTRGIMPVGRINDHKYGTDLNDCPMTHRIANLYQSKIEIEISKKEFTYL